MIRNYKSMVGVKVLEKESGELLGMVNGVVVDPDTGMVEAFWIRPATLPVKSAILRVSDILEFKKNLYIRSDRVFAQAEDVIRIRDILDDGRQFIGNSVQGEGGEGYGVCDDLSFDSDTYALKQISCRKSFLGLFRWNPRIFSYRSIIKVLPDLILVNDDASQKEGVIVTTPEAAAG